MIALTNGHTQLESFASPNEVQFDRFWDDSVTKVELDAHMSPKQQNFNCKCEQCDEWAAWAISELAKPDNSENGCRHPDHEWKLLFWNDNPTESGSHEEIVLEGQTYLVSTEHQEHWSPVGHRTPIEAVGVFAKAVMYSRIVSKLPSDTWEVRHQKTILRHITQGEPIAIWQYVLKCKVFNAHGMYINEAHFRTQVYHKTRSRQSPPTCDPNWQSCDTCV